MCKFGKWLHNSDLPESVKTSPHLVNIQKTHKDFHETAADIMKLVDRKSVV